MNDDEVWTQRIEAALTEVRGWESRIRAEPPDVDHGRLLGADDASDPAFTLSSMAWFGLQSSVDHLAQLADILTAPGGAPLRPYSPFTLTRTALLAAGQSVWLLSGEDRHERLRRTALVYKDEWEHHLTYLNDYKTDTAIHNSLNPSIAAAIDGVAASGVRQADTKLRESLPQVPLLSRTSLPAGLQDLMRGEGPALLHELSRNPHRLQGRQGLLRHRLDTHSPIGQRATQRIPRPGLPRATRGITVTGHSRLPSRTAHLGVQYSRRHRRSRIRRCARLREEH